MRSNAHLLGAQRLLFAGLCAAALASLALWLALRSSSPRGRSHDGAVLAPAERSPSEPDLRSSQALEATPGEAPEDRGRAALPVPQGPAPAFDPGALCGILRSPDGPVAGAEVHLFAGSAERGDAVLRTTQSDASGRFRFEGLEPHERRAVLVQHASVLPRLRALFTGHEEEIELERAAPVSGTVRSEADGSPLADVEVALAVRHVADGRLVPWERATSDAEGRWSLRWAEPGIQQFSVVAPFSVPETREFQVGPRGGPGFDILLAPARALELELYEVESGALLASTEVLADDQRLASDARGRLRVPPSTRATPDEALRLSLALPDGCLTQGRLERGPAPVLRVPLARGGVARGRVVDASGAPVAGATVSMSGGGRTPEWLALPAGFWIGPRRSSARTDADGVFRLDGLPPRQDLVEMRAHHPAYPRGRSAPFAFQEPGQVVELEIRLEEGGTLMGEVRLDGAPAPLRVHVSGAQADAWTRANDLGLYRMRGVAPGEVVVRARGEGEDEDVPRAEDRSVWVEPGATVRVDFALASSPARIRGRVVDAAGVPVEGARVRAGASDDEGWLEEDVRTESDEEGRFELALPDGGGLACDVEASLGPRSARASGVRAGAGEIELVLPLLAGFLLRVVDAEERRPVQGFQLYWRASEGGRYERFSQGSRVLSSGPAGTFLAELPADRLDLVVCARAQGFVPSPLEGVVGRAGETQALEFRLERGTTLELELAAEPGLEAVLRELQRGRAWIASEAQWAQREQGGSFFHQEVRGAQSLRLSAQGTARIPALAPGTYRFRGLPEGFELRPERFELPPVETHPLRVTLARARAKPGEPED